MLSEINACVALGERVLVTTLTKRMAEDLTDFLSDHQVKVRYLHSDVETVERVEIIRDLRLGVFDVLVGINLLREGLDIPEVALVAILDADKEGFLRSERSLIQTIGRAARHIEGRAILYGDRITRSMEKAIQETTRRRDKQIAFNLQNGITPRGVMKQIKEMIDGVYDASQGKEALKAAEQVVEVRGPGREVGCPGTEAAGESDARARPQPRVREGGTDARSAGAVEGAVVRRERFGDGCRRSGKFDTQR